MNFVLVQFLWFALGLCLGAMIVIGILILDFDNICDAAVYPSDEDIDAMEADFERSAD